MGHYFSEKEKRPTRKAAPLFLPAFAVNLGFPFPTDSQFQLLSTGEPRRKAPKCETFLGHVADTFPIEDSVVQSWISRRGGASSLKGNLIMGSGKSQERPQTNDQDSKKRS